MSSDATTVIMAIDALKRDDGAVSPIDVVEAARPPDSVLHDRFDSNAPETERLREAARLIRVVGLTIRCASKGSASRVARGWDPGSRQLV